MTAIIYANVAMNEQTVARQNRHKTPNYSNITEPNFTRNDTVLLLSAWFSSHVTTKIGRRLLGNNCFELVQYAFMPKMRTRPLTTTGSDNNQATGGARP